MYFKQISFLSNKINKAHALFFDYNKKEINFLEFIKFIFSNIKGTHLVEHTFYVAKISLLIAQELGLSPLEQSVLYWASVLHDLGKVHMPDEVIMSPHRLTNEEYVVMKMHPAISREIASQIPVFNQEFLISGRKIKVIDIILYHHERIDGKGYFSLRGAEIPYLAKIMAVADAFAAMTDQTRRFNRGRSALTEEVITRMEKDSGTQFDATILAIFKISLDKYNNKIEPNLYAINEIFKVHNGQEKSMIKHSDLFSFIEKFVNKKRMIDVTVNNKKYTITEIEEPYIIDQRPDNAYIMIHEKEKELAVITQKKYLMSKEEACKCLQFEEADFKKAYSFMDVKNNKFFFASLNLTTAGFNEKLNMFGSFTRDELRVFLEDNLRLTSEEMKKNQEKIENLLIEKKLIKEINPGVFSLQNIDMLTVSELRGVIDFRKMLSFLTANYVKNVEVKRELILKKWLDVKNKTITYLKNETLAVGTTIDDETLFKITPLIDYIPKINFRGVNLLKLKYIIEGVSGFYFSKEKFNYLKSVNLNESLILYYFIEMTVLLDKYFVNLQNKNIFYSAEKIYETLVIMKQLFPSMKKTLNLIISKFDYKRKKILFSDVFKKGRMIDIIADFYGTNGSIGFIVNNHVDSRERTAFFLWLKNNKELINPSILNEFEKIIDK